MRRLTGIIMMATVAYAGHLAINHYFTDNFEEKQAFSNLRTKLQKTLVMMDASSDEKTIIKKTSTQVIKKKSSASRATTISKPRVINTMKSTYDSLAEVSHIFRHEVMEMIEIIEKSAPMTKLNARLKYAQNWSKYIEKNVQKFNMGQGNKNRIANMVLEMQSYISGLTDSKDSASSVQRIKKVAANKVQDGANERKIEPVEVKKVVAIDSEPVSVSVKPKNNNSVDTMVKKSITESLVALKEWENSRKEANTIVGSFSNIWLAVVGFFAMIALWMSKNKSEDKLVVTESEDDDHMSFNSVDDENNEVIKQPSLQVDESIKHIDENYFFDEISNSLSTLCQAKGIILDTDGLEGRSEIVNTYQLAEVEQEIEDFTKTIIRSLGKEGTKTVKLYFNEKASKLKMIASVTSEVSLDINMTRVASGFRNLEEKLAVRNGVFNIEQSVSGNDIDFVMQLTAKEQLAADGKSEMNNVEEVEIVPPTD